MEAVNATAEIPIKYQMERIEPIKIDVEFIRHPNTNEIIILARKINEIVEKINNMAEIPERKKVEVINKKLYVGGKSVEKTTQDYFYNPQKMADQ